MTEAAAKLNLLDLDREGLERFFADTLGEKRFRAHQLMKWIYHQHVTDFSQMTDVGKALRAKLEDHCEIRPRTSSSTSRPPTERTNGCSAWTRAMRSKRCSSPTRAAARCACRARSAAD